MVGRASRAWNGQERRCATRWADPSTSPLTGEQVSDLQVIGGRIAEQIRAGLLGEAAHGEPGGPDCCE